MKRFLLLLATLAPLAGCGSSGSGPTSSDQASVASLYTGKNYAITELTDAPPCTAENEAQLIFVQAENSFYTCKQGAWVRISLSSSGTQEQSAVVVADEVAGEHCPTGGVVITQGESSHYVCDGDKGTTGDKGETGSKGEVGAIGAKGDKGDDRITAIYMCPQSAQFAGGYQARSSVYHEYANGKKFLQTSWEIVSGLGMRASVCLSSESTCRISYANSTQAFLNSVFTQGTMTYSADGESITPFSGSVSCEKIF
jgi:hypothetical protein